MKPGERGAIQRILRAAKKAGFDAVAVYDGEKMQRGKDKVMNEREVIEACDSVDDSFIHFRNAEGRKAWTRIILGNAADGSELPADNSVVPGFAEAMDSLCE